MNRGDKVTIKGEGTAELVKPVHRNMTEQEQLWIVHFDADPEGVNHERWVTHTAAS